MQLHALCPPTPAASPRAGDVLQPFWVYDEAVSSFPSLPAVTRRALLTKLLESLDAQDLLHVSQTLSPLLKRDFLSDLPPEVALLVRLAFPMLFAYVISRSEHSMG
jgi:F-box and WD-40 domain protein CDC4